MANDQERKLRDEQQKINERQLKVSKERLSLEERIQSVANKGVYGKGSAKALSQSTDVASFGSKSDLTSMERTITNSLADVIKQTSKADAGIKDQAEAKLQIQTLKKLTDTLDGPYKKDIVNMVDKVQEGVNQNASATKSTSKFIVDQMGAMTLTMLSSVFDSPALAAVGGMISNFTDFRKEKKQEAREFELLAISEQAKEVAVESVKLDEEATAKTHEFASLQQEKLAQANNTQQEIVDEIVEMGKTQDDLLVDIAANTKDLRDAWVDIAPADESSDAVEEKLDQLVQVAKDSNELAEMDKRDARENLREANNEIGKGNKGETFKADEGFLSFLPAGAVDFFQTLALVGSMMGTMMAKAKSVGILGTMKGLVKTFAKFIMIPTMVIGILKGGIEGWIESDGESMGARITETIQSAFGKMLSFLTFGLIDEKSLEDASAKLSESGMLDGVFGLIDSNIQMLTSIFEFLGEKLGVFTDFLGLTTEDPEKKKARESAELQLDADTERSRLLEQKFEKQGVELINREVFTKDELDRDAVQTASKDELSALLNTEKDNLRESDIQLIKELLSNKAGMMEAEGKALDKVNQERNTPQESGAVTQVNNSVNNSNAMAVMGIPGTQNQNDSYTRFTN